MTVSPGQFGGKSSKEEKECPGSDYDIVNVDEKSVAEHCVPHTFERKCKSVENLK